MAFRRVISLPSMPPRVRTLTPTRKSSNPETMMKESLGTGPEVSNQRNGKGDGTTSAGAWPIRSRSSPPSPLATTSSVYLELEESLAKHLAGDLSEETGINFADSRVFSLSPAPSRVFASSSGSLLLAHTASLISASLGQPRWIGLRLGLSSTQAGIEAGEDDTEVQGCAWSIDATHSPSIPVTNRQFHPQAAQVDEVLHVPGGFGGIKQARFFSERLPSCPSLILLPILAPKNHPDS
ncbi:hypothetical protein SELMODRAFT_422870 [Selaginella moellendorffii]|uniref:Uncharacterized protein n=1 Tax=Selaginella moellendorffii TaxID=88036 RepID=D8SJT9_SELML|nr:hypothetical protein SELMODRAFT_422870 [Selaginella moellendorffii]